MLFKNAGTHKREKHFTWKATRPVVCHADTSGKWAVVQDGQFGALEKKQKNHRSLQRRKENEPIQGASSKKHQGSKLAHAIQCNISRGTAENEGGKKTNNNNICLEASTSMHNGHVKTTTSACAC